MKISNTRIRFQNFHRTYVFGDRAKKLVDEIAVGSIDFNYIDASLRGSLDRPRLIQHQFLNVKLHYLLGYVIAPGRILAFQTMNFRYHQKGLTHYPASRRLLWKLLHSIFPAAVPP
jgi:hypothetical protein